MSLFPLAPVRLSGLLLLVLVLLAGASLLVGAGSLADDRYLATFLGLRGMRLAAACLIGAGLAVAGTVLQGLFRNPLAEPGIIGTNAGAIFGGQVAVILSQLTSLAVLVPTLVLLPLGCVAGGLLSLWLVLLVARRTADNLTVLLGGVIIGMFLGGLGAAVSAWAQDDWNLARSLVAFGFGGIDAKGLDHLLLALPLIAGGILAAWRWSPELDVLLSGEEEAASLGVDLRRARRWLVVWATLPVAGAVAIGGGIAFVGLVVPHLLRGMVGPLHRRLIPCAALGGAIFVLACDLIARLLPTRGELPVSVVTGLIGAPLFLLLLVRSRREAVL